MFTLFVRLPQPATLIHYVVCVIISFKIDYCISCISLTFPLEISEINGLIELPKVVRGHTTVIASTYIDGEILDVTKNSTNVQWTSQYRHVVPGFMAIYYHAKPLLVTSKAQKASLIVRTGKNKRIWGLTETSRVCRSVVYDPSLWQPISHFSHTCMFGIITCTSKLLAWKCNTFHTGHSIYLCVAAVIVIATALHHQLLPCVERLIPYPTHVWRMSNMAIILNDCFPYLISCRYHVSYMACAACGAIPGKPPNSTATPCPYYVIHPFPSTSI